MGHLSMMEEGPRSRKAFGSHSKRSFVGHWNLVGFGSHNKNCGGHLSWMVLGPLSKMDIVPPSNIEKNPQNSMKFGGHLCCMEFGPQSWMEFGGH